MWQSWASSLHFGARGLLFTQAPRTPLAVCNTLQLRARNAATDGRITPEVRDRGVGEPVTP